jgi:DNA-binding SARP family transcriptional activator/WD40 repeat protein
VDFRVLGPLCVVDGDRTVALGTTKEAALLTILLVHADEPVSAARLIDELWRGTPPPGAAATLQGYVRNLRRILEPDRPAGAPSELLVTRRPGYALVVGPDGSDVRRFERLAGEGRSALSRGDPAGADALLREALALWRGTPFGDLAGEPFARADAARLEERRLVAIEDRVEAGLRLGHHGPVVAELEGLVTEYPFREALWGQLMLALYRSGRQADALRTFARLRSILGEELGIEPGTPLRDLEEAILLQKPDLDWRPHPPSRAPAVQAVTVRAPLPAVLALDTEPLVGRRADLDWLDVLWARACDGEAQCAALAGPHGIGKSRLAAEFARRVHERGTHVSTGWPSSRDAAVPLLVVLNGADPAALGLDAPDGQVMLLVTSLCPPEGPPAGTQLQVRNLGGLGVDDVAAMLTAEGPVTAELVAAVHAETAGVPARVVEMARAMRERDAAERLERALARAAEAAGERRAADDVIVDSVLRRAWLAPAAGTDGACPYKGLEAFTADDAALFFGRERLVATLVARLAVHRFVGVVGASGSGKSSVVNGGLLPALAAGALPGSEQWKSVVCTPGTDPPDIIAMARAGARVVVVDQLEELVTQCRDRLAREGFLSSLAAAVGDTERTVSVVAVVRADYYGALAEHEDLARLFETSQVLVGALSETELTRAITAPAARVGLAVEDGLVDAVCADAGGEPGALPLVSTALVETWARRDNATLTLAAYLDAGGVRGALARSAEQVYAGFDAAERAAARRLFLRLAEPGEGSDDVRRRAPRDELEPGGVLDTLVARRLLVANDGYVEVAHEALLREWPRLREWLVEDREGRRLHRQLGEASIHWDGEGRDPAGLYRGTRLDGALDWSATHAEDLNSLEHAFLGASRAAHDAQLRRAHRLTAGLTVLLVVALFAGGVALVQRHNASRQAARAGVATRQAQVSRLVAAARLLPPDQTDVALLLGVEGRRFEPSVATEGALEAALAHVPPGLEQVLRLSSPTSNYADLSRDSRRLAAPDEHGGVEIWDLAGGRLLRTLSGPAAPLYLALFNADASLVVDTRSDGMARVWDVASGRQLGAPLPVGGSMGYAEFVDAHGARLLTATVTNPTATTTEGRVVFWDRQDPQHPRPVGQPFTVPMPPGGQSLPAETSPDGRVLVVSGGTTTTELWDVASHRKLLQLPGNWGGFTPDGATVATLEGDHISLWDPRTGVRRGAPFPDLPVAPLAGPNFSPDGRLVAIRGLNDGRVWVFDVAARRQVAALTLGPGGFPVAFLPDDRLVTAAGALVEVWRLGVAVPPMGVALGPPGFVEAAFAAGGTEVDTFGGDPAHHRMLRWDGVTGAARGRLLDARAQPPAPSFLMAPSPVGTAVAVGGQDGRVHLWDRATGEEVAVLDGHRGGELWAEWGPAGDRIATAGASQTVLMWDVSDLRHPVRSGPPLVAPGGPRPPVSDWANGLPWVSPGFSHDGRFIALVDHLPGRVTLFDRATGAAKWSVGFPNPSATSPDVFWAAFSPDDKVLAVTFSADPNLGKFTVTLLDAASGRRLRPLLRTGSGEGLAFLDGGRVIVTTGGSSGSQVAQLWDVATLQPIGDSLPAGALGGAFATVGWGAPVDASPDGTRFVTDGVGPTQGPVLWDAEPSDWATTACRIAGRNLTRAEWNEYFQGRPYHVTCPQWPPGT